MTRLLTGLVALLLLTSPGNSGEDKKPQPPLVTVEDMFKDAERHDGKAIRLDGVLESDPRPVGSRYILDIGTVGVAHITTSLKLTVVKGDRVRITGKFRYVKNSFVPYRLTADAPDGKVEKLRVENAKVQKLPPEDKYPAILH